jgi:alanyl-tRNA synthetase
LATELAQVSGRALYAETPAGQDGFRRVLRRVESLSEDLRAEAQSFTSAGRAIFLALTENPPSILLATSPNCGIHAGDLLKRALTEVGGRGGGNAALAQGSLPSKEALDQLVGTLASQLTLPS